MGPTLPLSLTHFRPLSAVGFTSGRGGGCKRHAGVAACSDLFKLESVLFCENHFNGL